MIKYKKIKHDIFQLLPKVKESLQRDPDIIFAYVFGSYGKGRPNPLSDVDIAIFVNLRKEDIFDKKLKLLEDLSKILVTDEIDLVILNDVPVSLAIEVLRTGRLILSINEEERLNYEVGIIKEYLDTMWLRGLSEKGLIHRIREGRYGFSRIG